MVIFIGTCPLMHALGLNRVSVPSKVDLSDLLWIFSVGCSFWRTVGAVIITIGFWGILYSNHNKERYW